MRQPNPNVQPEHARKLWDTVRSSTGAEWVTRCKLITPMFGGGVTPGEVDREMPIRASALRGQLRFWWRLLYRADRKPSDLFDVESDLWGSISSKGPRASRVTLQVRQTMNRGPGSLPASSVPSGAQGGFQLVPEDKLDLPAYALIPDPKSKGRSLLQAGYDFDLVLRFRQATTRQQEEVLEALRWWANFGGVGARTRRGLGAVKTASDDVELAPVTAEEVKARGGWMVIGQPESNAIKAWRDAVGALQHFRQGRNVGRNPGQQGNRPGCSLWPEPDTIRCATKTHAPKHKPKHPAQGFYPRAAFGLPIVFHFKDGGDPGTDDRKASDPTLEPVSGDRMASPLILRPWFDGQRYRPVALLLPRWKERLSVPVRLKLPGAPTSASASSGPASPETLRAWPEDFGERKSLAERIKPMHDHGQGATDPLTAFMNFFAENLAGGER